MKEQDLKALEELPQASTCRLIDFDQSQISGGVVSGTYFLTVSGQKPWISMKVQLIPRVYIAKPDYWGIEVVGCQQGIGLPAVGPYSETTEITNFTGNHGIEVIGASRIEKHDISS